MRIRQMMMQARDLVELGGSIAIHGRRFVAGHGRVSRSGIAEYWAASRCRFERWSAQLAELQLGNQPAPDCWPEAVRIVEEIFASEILTRLWTAVACESDRRQGLSFVSPVVRSTLLAHLSARNRALNAMAAAYEHQRDEAWEINRVRSRSERWTDLLLAHLLPDCAVADFAFDVARVQDFADDLSERPAPEGSAERWELLCVALRAAFPTDAQRPSANADLNGRIAVSIAAGFPPEQFAATGSFEKLWMQRLAFTTADVGAMVEELLATDGGFTSVLTRARLRRPAGTAG